MINQIVPGFIKFNIETRKKNINFGKRNCPSKFPLKKITRHIHAFYHSYIKMLYKY